MKKISLYRKAVLLGQEIRELIEEEGDDWVTDNKGNLHQYIVVHVEEWIKKYDTSGEKYSSEKMVKYIQNILVFIVREGLLYTDEDFSAVEHEHHQSNIGEINNFVDCDGSKDFAETYRDNGAYGSYPIFDDYSEEGDA